MPNASQMIIMHCKFCGAFHIPPKYLCTKCGEKSVEEYPTSGFGKIYTFTTIYVASELFKNQVPYIIAIVELNVGIRVTARVIREGGSLLKIGDPVNFLKKDDFGYWFKIIKEK